MFITFFLTTFCLLNRFYYDTYINYKIFPFPTELICISVNFLKLFHCKIELFKLTNENYASHLNCTYCFFSYLANRLLSLNSLYRYDLRYSNSLNVPVNTQLSVANSSIID